MEKRWWIAGEQQLCLAAVGRDGLRNVFVAKGSHPGEHCPKDRLRELHLDRFLGHSSKRTNTATVRMPVELKGLFSAQFQYTIDERDNAAGAGLKHFMKSLREGR